MRGAVLVSMAIIVGLLAPSSSSAAGGLWQGSMVTSGVGRNMPPADAQKRKKDCLRRSKTEEMCHRRCPGEPEGDCLRRVRGEKK